MAKDSMEGVKEREDRRMMSNNLAEQLMNEGACHLLRRGGTGRGVQHRLWNSLLDM